MKKLYQKQVWNRKNQLLRWHMIVAAIISIIACLIILLPSKTAYAIDNEKEAVYETIMIRPGDSLWSIAEEYYTKDCRSMKEYIEWIKSCNSLYDDTIHAGCYLIVPYYHSTTADC